MLATTLSDRLAAAIDEFGDPRGYLAAASIGLPPRRAVEAMRADLDAWSAAERDPQGYDPIIERTRASYARLVSVDASRVSIGSQTSVFAALIAAAAPEGAEIVLPEGDFSSIMFPFATRGGLRLKVVPLEEVADAITDDTWMVAVSFAQSATGVVCDMDGIVEAARRSGALVLCDTTQATGVHPIDASRYDLTVCHAYKWLCSPRGVAFMTVSESVQEILSPLYAGWYAGEDVWRSTYGPAMALARDARRFDVSPAWQAWVGAEQSIGMFADLDIAEVWERCAGLGDALCDGLGIREQHQAIVTWPDADGRDLHRLIDAGIRVSGRAGRLRASFHLWNDETDVDAVLRVIR